MKQAPTRLGQILLAQHAITKKQLTHALDYQALHGEPIGQCLIALGYIEQEVLDRALRRQSWLKPCAACLTCLCVPFTFTACYANENTENNFNIAWVEQQNPYNNWAKDSNLSANNQAGIDFVIAAAEAVWGIYQGEPKAGEWQYSLNPKSTGYSISMQMHF